MTSIFNLRIIFIAYFYCIRFNLISNIFLNWYSCTFQCHHAAGDAVKKAQHSHFLSPVIIFIIILLSPRVADRSADLMLAQRSFLTLARALKRALDVIFLQLPQYQHRSHRCQESLRYHRSHIRSHRPQSKEWCPRNKHYRPVHSVFLIRFCS